MISMLRLAQKYGDGCFRSEDQGLCLTSTVNTKVGNNVTFGDTLNMATGIGDTEPRRVSSYVEEDSAAITRKIIAAKTTTGKAKADCNDRQLSLGSW